MKQQSLVVVSELENLQDDKDKDAELQVQNADLHR